MKFDVSTTLPYVIRARMRWLALISLTWLFSGNVLAQFAYQCDRPNGTTFLSKSPCPAGMTWTRIRTDPYYTGPDPLSGVKPVENQSQNQSKRALAKGKAALASTGNPVYDQALEEYRHAIKYGDLGDYAAAKMKLKLLMGAGNAEPEKRSPPPSSAGKYVAPVTANTSNGSEARYRGSSGTGYKYDLSKPLDRTMYQVDPLSNIKDQVHGPSTPGVYIDQSMGQRGGGIVTK